MDDMTPEEYRAALNKRTIEFQKERRAGATKSAVRDYHASLDRP